ncbi:RCC1 domain-containing protein [Hyalangium rubrum]|uniref:Chromosome condensation regulator RCC1 n=1 Tax=Hyalangium rubrum TaxID=3103134 RepID=A0ABU5H9L5_9BACT|nr:chromosome condensation regulator RCC1 [Hyalangium sp. s54d21]MDY7230010.1 chromosome condensation regulator RCC1 [Hyalangium sp. s54d21]
MNFRPLIALLALLPLACGPESTPLPSESQPGGPLVLVFSPAPSVALPASQKTLHISGRVNSLAGLSEFSWQLDEEAATPLAFEPGAEEHPFTFTIPLSEGTHVLRLRALDSAGRVGTSTLRVTSVGPPKVQVLSPAAGQSVTVRRVRVEGTATGDMKLASFTWALNGASPQPLSATPGAFAFEVTPRPGPNTLILHAVDVLGNETEQTRSFHYGSRSGGGGLHTGVVRDGLLYTWGRNNRGQIGWGSAVTTDQKLPGKVPAFTDVAAMAFNQNSSLALKLDGTVWAWGENAQGQLGLGPVPQADVPRTPDLTPRFSPTRVPGLSGAVALGLGYRHALVLFEDGSVRAFGDNSAGQLGDGTPGGTKDYPVTVVGLTDVVKVVAGSMHSVALQGDGTVWAWGRNTYGNLGLGTADSASHPTPTRVPGLANVVDIATGRDHVLALHADGTVSSWGLDASGQLGTGEVLPDEESAVPMRVKGLADARAVFANGLMSYAWRADGSLVSWGQNFNGQLGNGTTTDAREPTPSVAGLKGLVTVAPGATHVVAFREDGELFTWGWNSRGSLGRDDLLDNWTYSEPIRVTLP